jgi:hypothetical protein
MNDGTTTRPETSAPPSFAQTPTLAHDSGYVDATGPSSQFKSTVALADYLPDKVQFENRFIARVSQFASNFSNLSDFSNFLNASFNGPNDKLRMDEIRSAMLAHNVDTSMTLMWANISSAPNLHDLWYLRSNLFDFLSHRYGERDAYIKLDKITDMFRGFFKTTSMPKRRIF